MQEGVGSSFASFGVGVSPTSLDFAFLEGETQEEEVKEDEEEEGEAWPPAEEPVEETTAGDQVAAEPTEERVQGAASPPTSVAAGAARRADSALTIPDSDYVSAGSSGEEGLPAGRAPGGGEGVRAAVESHPVEPASASEEESTARRGSEARDSPPPAASPPQQLPGPALGSRPAHTPATDYERELSAVEEEEARARGMAVDRRGPPGAGQGPASESASGTAAAASQPVSLLHRALQHLRHRLRRLDRESVVAYLAYVAVFVADYSLLALFFPLSMFVYALCSVKPTPRYWRVSLPPFFLLGGGVCVCEEAGRTAGQVLWQSECHMPAAILCSKDNIWKKRPHTPTPCAGDAGVQRAPHHRAVCLPDSHPPGLLLCDPAAPVHVSLAGSASGPCAAVCARIACRWWAGKSLEV